MDIASSRKAPFAEIPGSAWFSPGLTMICLAALASLVEPLSLLFRQVSRTYNEGWNAFWADAATHHGALYASADSLVANNYPPVSFYVVGLIGRLIGDNVIAGRMVSLASFVVLIAVAYLFLRAIGSSRRIAFTGAALLFAAFALYAEKYVAMNDPQLLAHALMLSALVVLWRFDFSPPAVIVGAVLMLVAGFTKHLLIPLPMAVTLWIAIYRRDRLAAWLACLAVGVPLGFWLISSSYPSFVDELLSARVYSLRRSMWSALQTVFRFAPLLAPGAVPVISWMRARRRYDLPPHVTLMLTYLALSLIVGAIGAGGEGVTRNAYFDLLIGSALLAALGIGWMLEHASEKRVFGLSAAPAAITVLGVYVTVHMLTTLPGTLRTLREVDGLEQDTRATVELIERLGQGRAACETLALCYWARTSFTMDFFNYGQKLATGALPVESCEAALQRGDFPVLQLEADHVPLGKRLGPCMPAIHQYYTEAFRSRAGLLLVPKARLAGL
jgi:hypothetical protein